MKLLKYILPVICAFLLCSCTGMGSEPDDNAFVVALGVDKSKNENYKVTLQYAKVTQISGGASEEGGKTGSGIIQNISVEAPDIYSAIDAANHIVSKTFSLSHAKLIVFSEEIARSGINDILASIINNNEIRPDVFIAVSKTEASKYLSEVKPSLEVNPAKYYQLIYHSDTSGGIPRTDLGTFYLDMEEGLKNPVAPLAGISEGSEEEKNKLNENAPVNGSSFGYMTKDYIAGEVALNSENKSETMGMAVFKDDKMIGTLGSVDCKIYNLLTGNLEKNYFNLQSDTPNKPIILKTYEISKPKYKIDKKNKKIRVSLYIESELYFYPDNENPDIEALQDKAKIYVKDACESFILKTRDEMECDILGIEEKLKYSFLTNEALNEYNFKEDFKNYEIEVNADIKIRRTGMKL